MKTKFILIISCLLFPLIIGMFGYIEYNDYRFEKALAESAKTPDSYWNDKYKDIKIKDSYKVVLFMCDGGELSYGEYFKVAAKKLGWEVLVFEISTRDRENEVLAFDPDFILFSNFIETKNMSAYIKTHRSKKLLVNFLPLRAYRNLFKEIQKDNPYKAQESMKPLLEIADAVLAVSKEVDYYRVMFEKLGKPYFDGFSILPLVPDMEYKAAEPRKLMWGGVGGDSLRYSSRYNKFIKLLSENVLMKVYGPYHSFSYLPPHVYDGYMMFGIDNINTIRQNGIYLLTHGQFHFDGNMPGLRIFEATAANAVVISDKLPFAIEHFGDSFLYFDQNADAETMYQQVKAHYDWIKANPEKAKAMADRAHQIFLEKFTLEKDLVRMAQVYEYLIKRDRDMGLSRPFVY